MHSMSTPTSLTEQIATTDGPIFYASRFLGLAPCSIEKKDSRKITFNLSIMFCVYSFTIATILIVWGVLGMLNDYWAGVNSIRMKPGTGRIITCADLSSIIFLACLGIFGAPFRLAKIRKFYNNLIQIDSILPPTQVEQFRNLSYYYLGSIFVSMTIVISLDIYAWIKIAEINSHGELVIRYYLPFYGAYYVVMILELQYTQGAKHIQYRFRQLNENLAINTMEKFKTACFKNPKQPWTVSVKPTASIKDQKHLGSVLDYVTRNNKLNDDFFNFKEKNLISNATEYVLQLCQVHSTLCEAVVEINESFGFIVLMIIVGALLHSIETGYFLLIELTERHDPFFIILQLLWIGVHVLRILIIIQPANAAMKEAKLTKVQVCNLLCYAKLDEKLRKECEIFSLQLTHRTVEFTACEICTLDRRLLSAITGAVATYLVILFQFK